MLKYMHAEFYKVFRRKYLYITMGVLLACAGLMIWGWAFTNAHGNHVAFDTGGGMAVMVLILGLYMSVIICDLVFSDQHKHNTLKNEVSYGLPRARIYLGKLLVQMIVGVVMAVAILVIYEALCFFVLLPSPPESAAATVKMIAYCTAAAIPQWLGMLAFANLMFFVMRSNTVASFIVVGVVVVPQTVLKLMGLLVNPIFGKMAAWMPNSIVEAAQNHVFEGGFMAQSWLAGLIWVIVCTAIGLVCYRRKEIS